MNLFTYVKGQLSILDVVSEYTAVKKAGLYWKGTCPFHNEKTASFTVSPHKEIFYCFGCHAGGDLVSFIAKVENCTPLQAVQLLIERHTIMVPEELKHEVSTGSTEERNHYFDICKAVAQWTHQQLMINVEARRYLTERSITNEAINYFSLGYFPGGPHAIKSLLTYMQRSAILSDDLIKASILSQGKTVVYSPFEERIIFPIKDHLGRFCGFGGRIFRPNDERAKYYNSRENSHFVKGSLLFGLDLAKQSIQKKEKAFLVEGYTDCVSMVQRGYDNTIATLGTACTLEHLSVLSRYAQQLYVVYDGDKAGQDAILRLTQMCWQVNMELQIICLPENEDPSSFLSKKGDLGPFIASAMDIFLFFIHTLGKNFTTKTLGGKLELAHKIIAVLAKIENPLKRNFLLQKAADTLGVPLESLQDALMRENKPVRQSPGQSAPTPQEQVQEHVNDEESVTLEKKLFFAIIHNTQLLNKVNEGHLLECLPSPMSEILKKLSSMHVVGVSLDFHHFFDKLTSEEQSYISKVLVTPALAVQEKDFEQLLLILHKKHWKHIVHTTKIKLTEAEQVGNKDTIEKILNDFLTLKKKMLHKSLL